MSQPKIDMLLKRIQKSQNSSIFLIRKVQKIQRIERVAEVQLINKPEGNSEYCRASVSSFPFKPKNVVLFDKEDDDNKSRASFLSNVAFLPLKEDTGYSTFPVSQPLKNKIPVLLQNASFEGDIDPKKFRECFENNRKELPVFGCSLACNFCNLNNAIKIIIPGPICNCGCPVCFYFIHKTDLELETQRFKRTSFVYTKDCLIELKQDRKMVCECRDYFQLRALSYSLQMNVTLDEGLLAQTTIVPVNSKVPFYIDPQKDELEILLS